MGKDFVVVDVNMGGYKAKFRVDKDGNARLLKATYFETNCTKSIHPSVLEEIKKLAVKKAE